MARTVYLHIGPPKTGTTYLQRILWDNKAALRDQGLLLPLGGVHAHFWASQSIRERFGPDAPHLRRSAWARMCAAAGKWTGDVLVTHELLAPADRGQASRAVADLAGVADEVHLVVTARDVARQLPSAWQGSIRRGGTKTLQEYVATADEPDNGFTHDLDLREVLGRWQRGLRDDQVHVVTVPPPGSGPTVLWARFAEAIGARAGMVSEVEAVLNPSLGAVETEVLRRSNETVGRWTNRERNVLRRILARGVLAEGGRSERHLPPAVHEWASKRADRTGLFLRERGYRIHGDLNDLQVCPQPSHAGPPFIGDPVLEEEVTRVALAALQPAVIQAFELGLARQA